MFLRELGNDRDATEGKRTGAKEGTTRERWTEQDRMMTCRSTKIGWWSAQVPKYGKWMNRDQGHLATTFVQFSLNFPKQKQIFKFIYK